MVSKVFFDTNILIYACDQDEPEKRDVSRRLILQHSSNNTLTCISTQVIQKFYVAATKKLGIEPLMAKNIIYSFQQMETCMVDISDINRAIDGSILWQVSFWDALIVAAAQKLRCDIIYTEDLNHGQHFDSVRVTNPFLIDKP